MKYTRNYSRILITNSTMKKILFFPVFLALAVFSFAHDIPNEYLFIEGTAENEDHLAFFLNVFNIEAAGAGFIVTETMEEAAYTFKFHSGPNTSMEFDDNLFVIRISLVDNADTDNEEILFFDFFFSALDEMYEYTQSIFQRATIYISPVREIIAEIDRSWQNKWLYIRASLDFLVTFYSLQPSGLCRNQAVYDGDINSPGKCQMLDNIVMPQPGIILGAELQFVDFMSFELNFQMNLGDPDTYLFMNMALGAQLKYNLKTRYFLIQPYGAFQLPLNKSSKFSKFPPFAIGAGIQLGVRLRDSGAFFIDLNYMHSIGDVHRINPFQHASLPGDIHYKRFVIGFGIGNKYGLFDRL